MTLDLWNSEYSNFNDTYNECDKINQMIRDFESSGRVMSGMIIKNADYKRNDTIDPFKNRTTSTSFNNTKKEKKPKKFKKLKGALTIGGIVGVGYLGYKYIYKPLKQEYDNMLDRIIVRSESSKPMDGKIHVMSKLEKKAYDKRYKGSTLYLDDSQYTVSDVLWWIFDVVGLISHHIFIIGIFMIILINFECEDFIKGNLISFLNGISCKTTTDSKPDNIFILNNTIIVNTDKSIEFISKGLFDITNNGLGRYIIVEITKDVYTNNMDGKLSVDHIEWLHKHSIGI